MRVNWCFLKAGKRYINYMYFCVQSEFLRKIFGCPLDSAHTFVTDYNMCVCFQTLAWLSRFFPDKPQFQNSFPFYFILHDVHQSGTG